MRRSIRTILAGILLFALFTVAVTITGETQADGYGSGYSSGNVSKLGYVHQQGDIYERDGWLYQRYSSWCHRDAGCKGCDRQKYRCYRYRKIVKNVNPKTPGWRDAMVDGAIAIKRSQQESNSFLETAELMGLSGVFFGIEPAYSRLNHGGYESEEAYGQPSRYSYSEIADILLNDDLPIQANQLANLGESQGERQADFLEGLQDLHALKVEGRKEAASYIGQAMLLRAAKPPTEVHIENHGTAQATGPVGPSAGQHGAGAGNGQEGWQLEALAGVIKSRCVDCHNPDATETMSNSRVAEFPTGVDMTKYFSFSDAQKGRVAESLAEGRMPKGGEALNMKELALFFNEWQP